MYSLVLSIFKGENFVVKGGNGYSAFLRAKCSDLQPELSLESGLAKLSPSSSEPEFNSQLAWSLSRKQLKELRSNRSTIKIACIVIDEKNKTRNENEVGYVVLHVKDATGVSPGSDVDPSKASTYPLLGTRDFWRTVQPKLQMILQLEELNERENRGRVQDEPVNIKAISQQKPAEPESTKSGFSLEPPTSDITIKNAAKLSETKLLQKDVSSRFMWSVNEKDGYFLLGTERDRDDLYILNTTVISASYLHTLWDGKSPRKVGGNADNHFWQIKYKAYGCEIASEPFQLSNEDVSRRTFIGDKATARIRTNGALFFEYLDETTVEFHIVRYKLGPGNELADPEVMGLCFASLSELSDPEKREHRVCMNVVSEWGTPRLIAAGENPEVRVMFTMAAVVNYFTLCPSEGNDNGLLRVPPNFDAQLTSRNENSSNKVDKQASRLMQQQRHSLGEAALDHDIDELEIPEDVPDSTDVDVENLNNSNTRRLLQFESDNGGAGVEANLESSSNSNSQGRPKGKPQASNTNTSTGNISDSEDTDSGSGSNKENLARILPEPGDYKVTIELSRFWLKSRKLIEDCFVLSYIHPPLGISEEPVENFGEPLSPEFTERRQGFTIISGEFSKVISITKFSESLISNPITVNFFRTEGGRKSNCFASAMIPFGRIFSERGHNNRWILEDAVDVLKVPSNIKIGTLYFKIKLCQETGSNEAPALNRKPAPSAFFPFPDKNDKSTKEKGDHRVKYFAESDRVTEELLEHRKAQEEMYKRQVNAYLKILSEESAQRDTERENAMAKKLLDVEKKEMEILSIQQKLDDREISLRKKELEVQEKMQQLTRDQEMFQQRATLAHTRLESNHNIEVDSLNRRIANYQEECDKWKSKVLVLERKLESKEAEIDSYLALKREKPDSSLKERASLLEQENKTLKMHLREAITRKEQYKKQSIALCQKMTRVQEERDQELKDQNESLRLQILATKEYKELRKDRKATQGVSHTIKAVQGMSNTMQALKKESVIHDVPNGGNGDQPDMILLKSIPKSTRKSNEDEILRLRDERKKLLETGAYTQFDVVIKELEKKMVTLAQQRECPVIDELRDVQKARR